MWYPNHRVGLVNRRRINFGGKVHPGDSSLGRTIDLPWDTVAPCKHYWKDSWADFIFSHWRYIKLEGEARYQRGMRFGPRTALCRAWNMLHYNLIGKQGWKCGIDGWGLSWAMSVYELLSYISLYEYQRKLKKVTDFDVTAEQADV